MHRWARELAAWHAYMVAAGVPASTIGLRTYHVRRLAGDMRKGPWEVTLDDLVAWLSGHSWAPNTRRAYRSSLRSFYSWGMHTGRVRKSPAHLLPPVRVPRPRPRPAAEGAYRRALAAADERERLAIMLAARCGLRRGEIATARREHLERRDALGWSLRVVGKGGHTRMVPVPDDLAADILARPDGWLFPSSHGGHLTPHHLGKLISRRLPGNLTAHTLRHRCATVAYAEGGHDLRAVQELLGHAKPETTAIYTLVPDADVRAAMLAAAA